MRGLGGGRFDKPSQPGVIGSYSEALYPPRVYHYYTQQLSVASSNSANIVVIPSIDDGVGDARNKTSVSQSGSTPSIGKGGPRTREFFSCFVDNQQQATDAHAFAIAESGKEPLNVLHYPFILAASDEFLNGDGTRNGHRMHHWEEALGLTHELQCYSLPSTRGGNLVGRLRIRGVKQKRLIKPMRRGAKVTVLEGATEVPRRAKRATFEDDAAFGGEKNIQKREDDDHDDEVGGDAYDKEDDEASVSFYVDDDDDAGDLDGPEGSGGDDDGDFFLA